MKAFITALALFVSICVFSGIHSFTMLKTADTVLSQCEQIINLANQDKWDGVIEKIDSTRNLLKKKRIWSALTVSAKNIEETETALNRSYVFAQLHQKPDFYGEFILFRDLIRRISAHEGLGIGEIL